MYYTYIEDLRQHIRVAHGVPNRWKIVIGWFESYSGSRQFIKRREVVVNLGDGYNDEISALGNLADVEPAVLRRTINDMVQKGMIMTIYSLKNGIKLVNLSSLTLFVA